MRLLRVAACITCVVVAALATPTTPVVSDAYKLPYTYLKVASDGRISITNTSAGGDGVVHAKAQFNRSMYDLGWDYLSVEGDGDYYSGYLEGYLTADRIELQGVPAVPPGAVGQWVQDHITFMLIRSKKLRQSSNFWALVSAQLSYIDGITAGLNAATAGNYTMAQVFLVSFGPELEDVNTAVAVQQGKQWGIDQDWKPSHCSALIKVLPHDLYVSHDTWAGFRTMAYRIYKVYNFHNNVVSFSSHPAFLASTDDWYMTGHQLAVQETTNGVMNKSLYVDVVPETVSEFLRVMTATFLSHDGESWTRYFAMYNSGTYNNQYMVVDFKLFAPGSSIVPNTLWVAEQLPGIVVRSDESSVLASQGYWASYNVPYFPEIYRLSGYAYDKAMYGDFYSYTKYARPEIFNRNQSDVKDLASMMRMMRYNDYQVDPFSLIHNCSGAPNGVCETPHSSMLSIASRGDLMPIYPTEAEMIAHYGSLYKFMAQGCFGALDSKIATWSNRYTQKAYVIAGPSNDQQPTFEWNARSCAGIATPRGTPTVVDYPWVEFNRVRDPLAYTD